MRTAGRSLCELPGGLAVFFRVVTRLQGPLTRPFFWTSGLFFTANDLPQAAREVVLYNPVLHATELVREGWFPGYTSRYVDPSYLVSWIVALTFLALAVERVARKKVDLA